MKTRHLLLCLAVLSASTAPALMAPRSEETQKGFPQAGTLSGAEMRIYLASMTVKEVRFDQAPVDQVLKHLAAVGREGPHPVNLVLLDPDKERPRITLDLRGASMLDILETVSRMAGLRMEYKEGILFFRDD